MFFEIQIYVIINLAKVSDASSYNYIDKILKTINRKDFKMKKTKFNEEHVTKAIRDFLLAIGENPDREGLKETPERVTKYWKELLQGTELTNKEIAQENNKSFEVGYDSFVTVYAENLFSHCEHHLALMYDGNVIIGYMPIQNENGKYKVLGLSKIYRIVDLCCKRLQLQEKLAVDIAECISLATGSKEVYVNLNMKHGCVSARGIKSAGTTNVTYMTENLRKNKQACEKFERKALEIIERNK